MRDIINPQVDFAFKRLFAREENVELLKSFINAVLEDYHPVPIEKVWILNPINDRAVEDGRGSIVDVKARDAEGHLYNIEMQRVTQLHYGKRALYYLSQIYTDQLEKGEDFDELQPTIGIHLMNFNYFPQDLGYHNVYRFKNVLESEHELAGLELHFIELKKLKTKNPKLDTMLEKWGALFRSEGDPMQPKVQKTLESNSEISKALAVLKHRLVKQRRNGNLPSRTQKAQR